MTAIGVHAPIILKISKKLCLTLDFPLYIIIIIKCLVFLCGSDDNSRYQNNADHHKLSQKYAIQPPSPSSIFCGAVACPQLRTACREPDIQLIMSFWSFSNNCKHNQCNTVKWEGLKVGALTTPPAMAWHP